MLVFCFANLRATAVFTLQPNKPMSSSELSCNKRFIGYLFVAVTNLVIQT
ncbi:hypothetical protein [Clostridium estertheticum]|nr:hypothetical protein [Clostridium estertheticum]